MTTPAKRHRPCDRMFARPNKLVADRSTGHPHSWTRTPRVCALRRGRRELLKLMVVVTPHNAQRGTARERHARDPEPRTESAE